MPEVRLIDANALAESDMSKLIDKYLYNQCNLTVGLAAALMPEIEAEPVRHGRWIECDYKTLEHGMIETEPKAGLCCSECRTGFQKKKMTYKQYCPACGARMDATDTNVGGKGGAEE